VVNRPRHGSLPPTPILLAGYRSRTWTRRSPQCRCHSLGWRFTSSEVWGYRPGDRHQEDTSSIRSAPGSMPVHAVRRATTRSIETAWRRRLGPSRGATPSASNIHTSGAITPDGRHGPGSQSTVSPCSSPWPASPWLRKPPGSQKTLRPKSQIPLGELTFGRAYKSASARPGQSVSDSDGLQHEISRDQETSASSRPTRIEALRALGISLPRAAPTSLNGPAPSGSLPFSFTAPEPLRPPVQSPCWDFPADQPKALLRGLTTQLNFREGRVNQPPKRGAKVRCANEASGIIHPGQGRQPWPPARRGMATSFEQAVVTPC